MSYRNLQVACEDYPQGEEHQQYNVTQRNIVNVVPINGIKYFFFAPSGQGNSQFHDNCNGFAAHLPPELRRAM